MSDQSPAPRIRWWPAVAILVLGIGSFLVLLFLPTGSIQVRNVALEGILGLIWFFLTVWWFAASRASWRLKLRVYGGFVGLLLVLFALFRVRGVTGDFVPIFEFRFASRNLAALERGQQHDALDKSGRPDFPQFLGPSRNAVINDGTVLARDWDKTPPQILWRKSIGEAWSGFAIVGNRAVTFAQRGDQETVICLDVLNGTLLWEHADLARYDNKYGGIGARSTPAIHEGRVYTFGATGLVNCLDLVTGKLIWQRTMEKDAPKGRPEWGYAGSPLVHDGKVLISAGQSHEKSLYAYSAKDGEVVWREGDQPAE
jgi:outer membrane protein assembly factor BamB